MSHDTASAHAKLILPAVAVLGGLAILLWRQSSVGAAPASAVAAQAKAHTASPDQVALTEPETISRTSAQMEVVQDAPTSPAQPVLETANAISGRVSNDIGEPVEGATVRASPRLEDTDELPEPEAVSDREGRFTIKGCSSAGTYWVGAELKGYWIQAHVESSAGASDVELILLRAGGLRGRVVEAFGSSVTDYVVVGRYEPPPSTGEPMTRERFERITRRMMKQTMQADISRAYNQAVLQQLFGEEQREEQRPDGEAWAHLQPDGSFELVGLKPGKASVTVAVRDRHRGLVTVSGIDVLPATVGTDPKVNPLDLNPYACVFQVLVRDPEGAPITAGSLDVQVNEDQLARFTVPFTDGRARFVGNLRLASITATTEGYQPVTVYSPAQIVTVTLQAK
jgi:hypothetical protein